MKQIRQSVFETNSSSTHSLSISGNNLNDIPESLHFGFGEFGWECEVYQSVQDKANYLWTYIFNHLSECEWPKKEDGTLDYQGKPIYSFEETYSAWKERLESVCREVGVKNITFEEYARKCGRWCNTGYVDHGYELGGFMEKLWENEDLLKQFLFCSDSGIETGNDNDDYDVDFASDNEIYNYYKGN